MFIELVSREAQQGHRILYIIRLAKTDHRLCGFILDSAEGLAMHSSGDNPDIMKVIVPTSQDDDFISFLGMLQKDWIT